MSAVWQVSRAAVKRRKVQTFVIGLVVLTSTVALVVALGLLDAASTPFDRTFDQQYGAHLVVTFDPAKATGAQLAEAAHRPGVTAVSGPFAQVVLTAPPTRTNPPPGVDYPAPGPITVVGRADPGGPVDRVDLWDGRWVSGPGEVVLMRPPGQEFGVNERVGSRILLPDAPPLTIVGFASSLSQSAGAWVTPGQMAALHPTATQLLLRFAHADTDGQVAAGLAAVTAGLPPGASLGSLSYLAVKQDMTGTARAYVPFLLGFGVLGLVVAVLIVANVVSGAVVSGFRHIGVLKALGFTPNQVVSVYLVMVLAPGVAGAVLGTGLGHLAAQPLLRMVFQGFHAGYFSATLSPWVEVLTLLGMPATVLLAALVPALRAHRLSAARAISAGSAPRAGRGLRVQRRLSGTRLPRAVSLGLGLPFARPGRTALTLASLALGVTTVTLATGLASSVNALMLTSKEDVQTVVYVGDASVAGQVQPKLTDQQIDSTLRALPGAARVAAAAPVQLHVVGADQGAWVWFLRGDSATVGGALLKGRWLNGPGEVVAPTPFLRKYGLSVGSRLTLELNGRQQAVTVVGENLDGNADSMDAGWGALTALTSEQAAHRYVNQYWVGLAPGADVGAYDNAVKAAEPGLEPAARGGTNSITVSIVGSTSVLTLLLSTVAALGVFNTVVLNARERRRDLGMLKSIGMTPRQVRVMMVTSMAALGLAGGVLGVPVGIAVHHVIIPAMTDAAGFGLPPGVMAVWHLPLLALLVLAGIAIAVLGALVPAHSAARLTIAEVLRNE
ncbi:hypothetical protein GCM10009760_46640 [Kitasatospora kazusensis]|uniref:ABC transport system permease protein n=1 Tax=Kitasatospora kazusensis TaxID=407974 RepID=A0ABN3A128_9ACTN